MKPWIAIALIAGAASSAQANRISFAVDGFWVTDAFNTFGAEAGASYTIDVVLNATDRTEAFYAWRGYTFSLEVRGAFSPSDVGGKIDEDDPLENAETTAGTGIFGPWTGGRRPGAFPGSRSNNGGSRFGDDLGNVITNTEITGPNGYISGQQQSPGRPDFNALIHTGQIYAAYRFEYTYHGDGQPVTFGFKPDTTLLSVYTDIDGNAADVLDFTDGPALTFVPAPASVGLLVLGGLAMTRRR